MHISISGPVGSGKTTTAKLLKEKLKDYEIVSIGKLQREAAKMHGMDITQYSAYRLAHPEKEKEIDDLLKTYNNKEGNFIFDSRLAFHFIDNTFKVAIVCSDETAAKRILKENREDEKYKSLDEAISKVIKRRANDMQSYLNCYRINIYDYSQFDLVVNTDNIGPEKVANRVFNGFQKYIKKLNNKSQYKIGDYYLIEKTNDEIYTIDKILEISPKIVTEEYVLNSSGIEGNFKIYDETIIDDNIFFENSIKLSKRVSKKLINLGVHLKYNEANNIIKEIKNEL